MHLPLLQVAWVEVGTEAEEMRGAVAIFTNRVIAYLTYRMNSGNVSSIHIRNSKELDICIVKQSFLDIYLLFICSSKYIQAIYMQDKPIISTQFAQP